MIFEELKLQGAWLIRQQRHEDERGYFARSFCQREYAKQGLVSEYVQCNVSFNQHAHTLRGMHFQRPPAAETKIVSCSQGSLFDVIVDLRTDSPQFGHWLGVTLCDGDGQSLYIPAGFAHGFMTLEAQTRVDYMMSEFYQPDTAACLHYADEDLGIEWPASPVSVSPRDAKAPSLKVLRSSL